MARRTLSLAVEVLSTSRGVACGQICGIDGSPASSELRELVHLAVNKSDDGAQILFAEVVEGRHACVRPPGADQRRELIAMAVLSHHFRARQVRTRFATCAVFAVAKAALRAEPRFTLPHLRGGVVLRRR